MNNVKMEIGTAHLSTTVVMIESTQRFIEGNYLDDISFLSGLVAGAKFYGFRVNLAADEDVEELLNDIKLSHRKMEGVAHLSGERVRLAKIIEQHPKVTETGFGEVEFINDEVAFVMPDVIEGMLGFTTMLQLLNEHFSTDEDYIGLIESGDIVFHNSQCEELVLDKLRTGSEG